MTLRCYAGARWPPTAANGTPSWLPGQLRRRSLRQTTLRPQSQQPPSNGTRRGRGMNKAAAYGGRSTETGQAGCGAFDDEAAILDVVHAGLLGDPTRLGRDDAQLQPDGRGADRRSIPDHLHGVGRRPEHVNQVDRVRDCGQRRVRPLAEEFVDGRIDRDNPPAVLLHLQRHAMCGLARVAGRAYDGDNGGVGEDLLSGTHPPTVAPPEARAGPVALQPIENELLCPAVLPSATKARLTPYSKMVAYIATPSCDKRYVGAQGRCTASHHSR